MENATKALEMAGSVLIGLLILGCLVFVYTKISENKKQEDLSDKTLQASEFNKDFEAYNRNNIYGTELFSLANKIDDYNTKEAEAKAYGEISITITLKEKLSGAQFFTGISYTGKEFNECYKNLSEEIKKLNKEYFGKNVSYWSKYQDTKVRVNDTYTRLEEQIIEEIRTRQI